MNLAEVYLYLSAGCIWCFYDPICRISKFLLVRLAIEFEIPIIASLISLLFSAFYMYIKPSAECRKSLSLMRMAEKAIIYELFSVCEVGYHPYHHYTKKD